VNALVEPILVVDDEVEVRQSLLEGLSERGFTVESASGATEALARMKERRYAVVVTDLNMPGGPSGLELLAAMRAHDPRAVCVMITAFATLDTAIQALQNGAYDFIQKPFKLHHMEVVLNRALEHSRMGRQLREYQLELERKILGRTQEIKGLYQEVLALCDLTAASQRIPGIDGVVDLFMEHLRGRWNPSGLGCYLPRHGQWRLIFGTGSHPLPPRLGRLEVGWEEHLGYEEAHGMLLTGNGPEPAGLVFMGFDHRSSFSPMDPDFVLFLRHMELALHGHTPGPARVAS
jgi:FixJ family two-component response regulator